MTVLSMSIVVAPQAKAAASTGDLIKISGLSSVYYLGAGGKRYVFPNEATYFSWYKDFSGVVTIPASEMEGYPLAANVVVRPGTKLIKSPSINTVYAVGPNGVLSSVVSEANAISLYGANWNKKVIDVIDSFFVNYTIGAPLALGKYPVGQLVKTSGSADVMLLAADGTARKFANEAAFTANGYNFNYVETVPSTFVMPSTGAAIAGAETGLNNVAQSGVATGPIATGSGISIALSSDSPASASIPKGASRIELAKFNVTAANDGNAVVNSIMITRTGLGDNGDFPKIWIEKAGVRLTAQKTINSDDQSILTFAPALNIPAGQTVILSVFGSVAADPSAADAITIKAAADIDASGATVSGSFPISGNEMSFASYTVATSVFTANTGTLSATVGDEDITVGSFSLQAGSRNTTFKKITLKNTGNADLSQVLGDVRLEKSGTKVSESTTIDGKNITFVLANNGYALDKNESITFNVVGNVIDEDTSNNTVTLKLNASEDLVAEETSSGFSTAITNSSATFGTLTLSAGDNTVSKSSDSPSAASYTKSVKGIVALLATVKAKQAFTADGITLGIDSYVGQIAHFENVKLYINNVLVDSVDPSETLTASATSIVYDSSVSINKGTNIIKVVLDTNSSAVENDAITLKLTGASAFDTPVYANDDSVTVTGTATAGTITVATAGLTATRSDGFSANKLVVKGAVGAVLGRFTVKAQNDDVKITSVTLGDNAGTATQITDSNLTDLQLFVDDSQIGSTKSFNAGATFGSLSLVVAKDTTKVIVLRGSIDSSEVAGTHFQTPLTFAGEDSNGKAITSVVAQSVQVQIADSGTLTIAKDGDSPVAAIVAANTTGNSLAKFKLTATNDDITLKKIYISNLKGTGSDSRISNIDLYNGSTKIGSAAPTNGEVYYNLNSSVVITKGTSITLEAKADFNQIDESSQTNKDVQLAITKVTANSSAGNELSGSNNAIVNFASSTATLSNTITAASSSFAISDGTKVAVGSVIKVGTEEMLVTGIVVNQLTVTRGIDGTAVAAHTAAVVVYKASSIAADSFRVRKTYPIITLDTLPSTVLTSGDNVVAKIKVSAQANADVTIASTTFVANATVNTVQVASSSALNSVRVNGSIYSGATVTTNGSNATGKTMTAITVEFTNPVTVAAGTTKTIEVVLNVTSLTSVNNNLTTKIASDVAYATDGTFLWSDNADSITPSATYAGSYKVLGIPTVSQSLAQN